MPGKNKCDQETAEEIRADGRAQNANDRPDSGRNTSKVFQRFKACPSLHRLRGLGVQNGFQEGAGTRARPAAMHKPGDPESLVQYLVVPTLTQEAWVQLERLICRVQVVGFDSGGSSSTCVHLGLHLVQSTVSAKPLSPRCQRMSLTAGGLGRDQWQSGAIRKNFQQSNAKWKCRVQAK